MSYTENHVGQLKEQAEHWKTVADQIGTKLSNAQEEFEEFQSQSKELEKELETQNDQFERKNRDLTSLNQKLSTENESLRAKLQTLQSEDQDQLNRLESELEKVKNERDEMQRYIRDLEQSNDDLDRAKREAVVSLEDFEKRLNDAIERNAMLENELDEKDILQAHVQRLKDETRDLRHELKVKDKQKPPLNFTTPHPKSMTSQLSLQRPESLSLNATPSSSSAFSNGSVILPNLDHNQHEKKLIDCSQSPKVVPQDPLTTPSMSFSASSRISALNIVSDLLRKVGALETKLASSKRFSVDHSRSITPALTPISSAKSSTSGKIREKK